MAHKVICLYCKKQFDRDKEPTKQVSSRRYAHMKCWEEHEANMTQEEKDVRAFYEYTQKLFGEDYNYILTKKLAERYVKENHYTYTGMLKTLKWYYEKEGNSIEKSNGSIGIIPYIYKQALDYYYSLYLAQQINKEKNISSFIISKEREISIQSPRVYVRPPHMWLEEEDE
jgi:hypothetical protein